MSLNPSNIKPKKEIDKYVLFFSLMFLLSVLLYFVLLCLLVLGIIPTELAWWNMFLILISGFLMITADGYSSKTKINRGAK